MDYSKWLTASSSIFNISLFSFLGLIAIVWFAWYKMVPDRESSMVTSWREYR